MMAGEAGLSVSELTVDLADVSNWFLLGSSLGLETSQLNVIERDVPAVVGATDQRKSQVLHTWVKGKTGEPSWRDVVAALIKMGEHKVAEKMRMKYSGCVAVQPENDDALEITRENEHKLRELFVKLVQLVSTKLQAKPIDMEKFSSMVKHYFSGADCISTPGNVEEIFLAIGRNELWDFMNYSPLEMIAKAFGGDDSDLKRAFQEYREALAGYRVSTKVVHYFATRKEFSEEAYYSDSEQTIARRDQRYFVKLSVKLKAKATEKSLQYLIELWERVSEYLLLPALPYLLDEIITGSILVIWLVPRSIILALITKCMEPSAAKYFAGYDICSLTIDGLVLYEEKVEDSISVKKFPDSQRQVEKEPSLDITTETTQLDSIKHSSDSQEPIEREPTVVIHETTQLDSSMKQFPDSQKPVEKEPSPDTAKDTAKLECEKEEDEWCESQLELFRDIVSRERKIRKRIEEENDKLKSTIAYNEVKIGQLEEELTKLECELSQAREEQKQETEASAAKEEELRKQLVGVRDELSQARQTHSEADIHTVFTPTNAEPTSEPLPLPAWIATATDNYRPNIIRISSVPMTEDPEYQDPEAQQPQQPVNSPSSPVPPAPRQLPPPAPPARSQGSSAPPLPPRHTGRMQKHPEQVTSPVYTNVDQPPPVPPRQRPSTQSVPPILPPRTQPYGPSRQAREQRRVPNSELRKAYLSKIFNGCPLHLNCAASWTHPSSPSAQYVLFGADEGLFSLLVTNNPDPVMEQVSSRPCHWLRVVENGLIWLSGHNRIIYMTDLVVLFQSDAPKASLSHRHKQHTTKIPDSKGCIKCCISRNPFSDKCYLIAAVPKGLLLMQWYQPKHAFMHVMLFDCQLPSPIKTLDAFVRKDEEYPIVCFGVKEAPDSSSVVFDTLNLNSQSIDQPEGKDLPVLCMQQLEKDTILIGLDRYAMFVGRDGKLKPSSRQASQIVFERISEHMIYLPNCVLSFHKHGMQGKSLVTQKVTVKVHDESKIFHLLGSIGTIIIETRRVEDPTGASNIYILISEEQSP